MIISTRFKIKERTKSQHTMGLEFECMIIWHNRYNVEDYAHYIIPLCSVCANSLEVITMVATFFFFFGKVPSCFL